MEAFGIIGMTTGAMAFIFSITALARLDKLVKQLKKDDVLDKDFKSS